MVHITDYPEFVPPDTSLEPTPVGAGRSAARLASQARRGSVLGR
jgi:hypothetical protein